MFDTRRVVLARRWDLAVVVLSAGHAGAAAVQTPAEERYAAPADEILVLKGRVEEQEASLRAGSARSPTPASSRKRRRPGWTAPTRSGSRATA